MTAPVLIMAGGTGGHIMPALAVAAWLKEHSIPVVWLGTERGLEAKLVPQAGYPIEWISVAGLRSSGWRRLLQAPFMLLRALWQAIAVLRRLRPCVVLGMGGFASGPGAVAARCLGLPLIIHEQNAIPGMTNRYLARMATRVLQSFPGTFPAKVQAETVGNPVRSSINALPAPEQRWQERSGAPRLLVLGGSLGAQVLNQTLPQALSLLPPELCPEVWHQTGSRTYEQALAAYQGNAINAQLVVFIDDMAAAYAWADLVLCRAGATTIAELAIAGVGSVVVPYPHAVDDHQTANARFLEQVGAARILPQTELTASTLSVLLAELLADRDHLLSMATAARNLAQPAATQQVAHWLSTYCSREAVQI